MSAALDACADENVSIADDASFAFAHIAAGITISGIEWLTILTPLCIEIASLTPFFTAINNNFPAQFATLGSAALLSYRRELPEMRWIFTYFKTLCS